MKQPKCKIPENEREKEKGKKEGRK